MSPLNGARSRGSRGRRQVDGLGATEFDVGARRVEVSVVGDDAARAADDREEDLLGGPSLVSGDHVLEGEELLDRLQEPIPRRRPGIALVAVLDGGPLVAAHRAGARVGQQIDDDVLGVDVEQVVARGLERAWRSSTVVSRIGSTEWMRNGSMIVCQRSTQPTLTPDTRKGPGRLRDRGLIVERLLRTT